MTSEERARRDLHWANLLARLMIVLGVISLLAGLFAAGIREALAGPVTPPPAGVPTEVLHVATDASYWPMEYISGTQIAGHDIDHQDFPGWGVRKAVEEVMAENGIPVEELQKGSDYTWWFWNPVPKRNAEPDTCNRTVTENTAG